MTIRHVSERARIPFLSGGQSGTVGDIAPLRMISRALTNYDVRHLHSAPIELIPAPGLGLAIVILSSIYQNVKVGASFDDGGAGLFYGNTGELADGGDGAFPFVYDDSFFQPQTKMTGLSVTPSQDTTIDAANNAPVVLRNSTNMSAGGGYGRITVVYFVMQLQTTPPI